MSQCKIMFLSLVVNVNLIKRGLICSDFDYTETSRCKFVDAIARTLVSLAADAIPPLRGRRCCVDGGLDAAALKSQQHCHAARLHCLPCFPIVDASPVV